MGELDQVRRRIRRRANSIQEIRTEIAQHESQIEKLKRRLVKLQILDEPDTRLLEQAFLDDSMEENSGKPDDLLALKVTLRRTERLRQRLEGGVKPSLDEVSSLADEASKTLVPGIIALLGKDREQTTASAVQESGARR